MLFVLILSFFVLGSNDPLQMNSLTEKLSNFQGRSYDLKGADLLQLALCCTKLARKPQTPTAESPREGLSSVPSSEGERTPPPTEKLNKSQDDVSIITVGTVSPLLLSPRPADCTEPSSMIGAEHFFGNSWNTILFPDWFIVDMNKQLRYLRECGLNVNALRLHFSKNWNRILNRLVILDTGFDVGSCHIQALVNQALLAKYSHTPTHEIPTPHLLYLCFCLLLSDHSEIRHSKGSIGHLHSPEHANVVLNPNSFPFLRYTIKGTAKTTKPVAFFPKVRQIAAMQTLVFYSQIFGDGKELLDSTYRDITGVLIPRSPYPETFSALFKTMEEQQVPFVVDLAHLSSSEGLTDPQLTTEHALGFYNTPSSNIPNEYLIIFELYTVGLDVTDKHCLLESLCHFRTLKQVIMEVVLQGHADSIPKGRLEELRTVYSPAEMVKSSWLNRTILDPNYSAKYSLFSEKFGERYILGLLQEKNSGIAPRHVYCSTWEEFQKTLPERELLINKYHKQKNDHLEKVRQRHERKLSED